MGEVSRTNAMGTQRVLNANLNIKAAQKNKDNALSKDGLASSTFSEDVIAQVSSGRWEHKMVHYYPSMKLGDVEKAQGNKATFNKIDKNNDGILSDKEIVSHNLELKLEKNKNDIADLRIRTFNNKKSPITTSLSLGAVSAIGLISTMIGSGGIAATGTALVLGSITGVGVAAMVGLLTLGAVAYQERMDRGEIEKLENENNEIGQALQENENAK